MAELTSIMGSLGQRLRELRLERRLTGEQLAARVQGLGGDLGRVAITKIESTNPDTQRRVTVEELFLLAAALNVRPIDLVLPADGAQRVAMSGNVERTAKEIRDWCLGAAPVPWDLGTDWEYYPQERERQYHGSKPDREHILWLAGRHPAVRAAKGLLDHCESFAAKDWDPILFEDMEPELALVDIESSLANLRGHLEPTLREYRRIRDSLAGGEESR